MGSKRSLNVLQPATVDVEGMFESIAKRYDLMNDILSCGLHRLWRRDFLRKLPAQAVNVALDLCTGSGAMIEALSKRAELVVGLDFCREMMRQRHAQGARDGTRGAVFLEGDVHALPLFSETVDIVTVGFGVRNFRQLKKGLQEAYRVLKPGGHFAVLELGQPDNLLIAPLYSLYSRVLMPSAGAILAGNRRAYQYLRDTSSNFPCGEKFRAMLEAVGFESVSVTPYSMGIAWGYHCRKPSDRANKGS